jgi:chemotaxis protein methyltransferase CheR
LTGPARGGSCRIEVNRGLPASHLVKYFTRTGLDWQLKDNVRRMVEFQKLDLRQSLRTLGPFDVAFCRNVLIYFDVATKKKILDEIRSTIHKGGYLLLGGAESTFGLSEGFERLAFGSAAVYRVL